MIVRDRKLDPHQRRFQSANHKKDQPIRDIHQTDLLVVDRRHPLVHHVRRRPSLVPYRLVDGFQYRSCARHVRSFPQCVSEAL